MNILMMTNVYTPFVGGVERSVQAFAQEYARLGHRILIVAPEFDNIPPNERNVIRVPAIRNFHHTDFSVQVPIPGVLYGALRDFCPDLVHSQHPFLLGDTALRVAARFGIPLVYTFHTFYEQYTHYAPADSKMSKRFAAALTAGYANLADLVFAPSASAGRILRHRGVKKPLVVVPTGIDLQTFCSGNRTRGRATHGIPPSDFVLGTVGRLAIEKNLDFLVETVSEYLLQKPRAHFILVGVGPQEHEIMARFGHHSLIGRVHNLGLLEHGALADAYQAMDAFVFSSETETQGIVVTEALAAGVPVVALSATGVMDVVADYHNGRLVRRKDAEEFFDAIEWIAGLSPKDRERIRENAIQSVKGYSKEACAARALLFYRSIVAIKIRDHWSRLTRWERLKKRLQTERDILAMTAHAATDAIRGKGL